jgi:SAM-dependent methyltransferase
MQRARRTAPPAPRTDADTEAWLIRCAPGLEGVARAELRYRGAIGRGAPLFALKQRNHDVLFSARATAAFPGPMLRIPEQILSCLAYGRYKISQGQIARVAETVQRRGRPLRLVVTADGAHFARHELRRWLALRLAERGAILSDEVEEALWVFCIDEAYYICLQHSAQDDAPFRAQRTVERPGALPPTIAAALAFLGNPAPGETILDPVCGSGTLLAEAYGYVQDAELIGIDADPAAVAAARANLAHVPHHTLRQGDGTRTGLPAASVTLFLANLPFGKQYGDRATNPRLYGDLLREMARVGVPGAWRAVLLSSDVESLDAALAAASALTCTKRLRVKVRGEWAQVAVVAPTVR